MINRTLFGCRSNRGAQAWRGQARGAVLPSRLIANIFQGTDVVPRGRDNPFKAPRTIPTIPYADRFWPLQILARDLAGNQYT